MHCTLQVQAVGGIDRGTENNPTPVSGLVSAIRGTGCKDVGKFHTKEELFLHIRPHPMRRINIISDGTALYLQGEVAPRTWRSPLTACMRHYPHLHLQSTNF